LEFTEVCTLSVIVVNKLVDFYVILARPGGRVAKRKHCRSKIGVHQKVSQSDAVAWFKNKYDAVVLNR
jgi:large subunit ribosomal protein L11e